MKKGLLAIYSWGDHLLGGSPPLDSKQSLSLHMNNLIWGPCNTTITKLQGIFRAARIWAWDGLRPSAYACSSFAPTSLCLKTWLTWIAMHVSIHIYLHILNTSLPLPISWLMTTATLRMSQRTASNTNGISSAGLSPWLSVDGRHIWPWRGGWALCRMPKCFLKIITRSYPWIIGRLIGAPEDWEHVSRASKNWPWILLISELQFPSLAWAAHESPFVLWISGCSKKTNSPD